MQPIELIRLVALPEQNIKKLSFCASNKAQRVAEWASLLRPTQIGQTSASLYAALPELNRLIVTPQARYEMLESLRPYVQNTISGLSKNFLHQPLALTPEAQKSVIIAQALQKHMVDGYIICIREFILNNKKKTEPSEALINSLHRAMTGIGLLFMRCFQIYTQPTRGYWLALHALFRIADNFELLDKRVKDEINPVSIVTSIQNAYLRTIMLSASRPHQLGQNDINAIYNAFSDWADHVRFKIELSDNADCFYYVNLDRDAGPLYKSRVSEDEAENLLIELHLKPLLSQLAKHTGISSDEELGASAIQVPKDVSTAVLSHVLDSWSNVAQRKQERRDIQMTADLVIGLIDSHYFVCNGQDFESFLHASAGDSVFEDSTGGGFTPRETFGSNSADKQSRPTHRVEVQNVSQGGYCLLWKSSNPLKIQSGELVVLKEFGKRDWTVGVVRWIRQKKNSSQLGVQILTDRAQAYALAQNYDMGGQSDFMRALFIPASQFSNSPASLITSSAPFQTMDRVTVLDGNQTISAKLDERLFSTSSIQQFSYRNLDSTKKANTASDTANKW